MASLWIMKEKKSQVIPNNGAFPMLHLNATWTIIHWFITGQSRSNDILAIRARWRPSAGSSFISSFVCIEGCSDCMQPWLRMFSEVLGLYGKEAYTDPVSLIPPPPKSRIFKKKAGCLLMSGAWVNSWRRRMSCGNMISLRCLPCLPEKPPREMQIVFTSPGIAPIGGGRGV